MAHACKRPAVRADLADTWSYIVDERPRRADQLLGRIEEMLYLTAEQPKMGRGREEIAPRLRSFPVGSYLIYYRLFSGGEGVEVA